MRTKRRMRFWLTGLTLLGVTGAIGLCWPRERLLMQEAHKVTSAHGWSVDRGPDACTTYAWLSDHEVLFCQAAANSGVAFYRRDVRTGPQVPLAALSRYFQTTHGDVADVSVSPDRHWVMWYGGADSIVCASLDGAICKRTPWPKNGVSEFLWLYPSGAQWIELVHTRSHADGPGSVVRMTLHDSAYPDAIVPMPLPLPDRTGDGTPGSLAIRNSDGISLLVASVSEWISLHHSKLADLTQTSLTRPRDPPRVFPQRLPHNCSIKKMWISPDGKRIAWLVALDTASPLSQLLHRLIPAYPAPSHISRQLWVSRVQSGDAEEIGHLKTSGDNGSIDPLDSNTLQWLPDGSKLSFVYGDDLYIVAAP